MPTYFYACTNSECGEVREDDASMSSFKEHHPACHECGTSCDYTFIPTVPQVAFKDGPSGSWPSKGERFKKFRAEQSVKMEKRQYDRYGDVKKGAVPNYNGKDTGTWQEAQFQAMKDKGAESAATFNQKVAQEKASADKGKIKI